MKKNFSIILFSFVLFFLGICFTNQVEASEFANKNVWDYVLNNNSYTVKSGEGKYDCDQQTQNSCNFDFDYEYQIQLANPSIGGSYLFYGISKPINIQYEDLKGSYPSINDRFVVEKYQFNGEFVKVSGSIGANTSGSFAINDKGIYKIYTGEVSFHQTIYLIYETEFISMSIENVEFINDDVNPILSASVIVENAQSIGATISNVLLKVNDVAVNVYSVVEEDLGVNNTYSLTVLASLSGVTDKVVKNGIVTVSVKDNVREYSNVNYDIEDPKFTSITYFNNELQSEGFGLEYDNGIILNDNPNGFAVRLAINEASGVKSVSMNGVNCLVDNENKVATCNILTEMYTDIVEDGLTYRIEDEFDNSIEVYHDSISFEQNILSTLEIETSEDGTIKVKGETGIVSKLCLFYGDENWLNIQKFECGEGQVNSSYTYSGDVQVVLFNNHLSYSVLPLENVNFNSDKEYLDAVVNFTIDDLLVDEFSILDAVNELPKVACGNNDSYCKQQGTWEIVYKRHVENEETNVLYQEEFDSIEVTTLNFLDILNNKIRAPEAAYEHFDLDIFVVFKYEVGGIAQSISKQHTINDELPMIEPNSAGIINVENIFIEFSEFESNLSTISNRLYETDLSIAISPQTYGSQGRVVSRIVSYQDLDNNSVEIDHTGLLPHEYLQANLELGRYVLECRLQLKQPDQSVLYTKSFFINVFVKDSIMPVLSALTNKQIEVKQYDVYKDAVPKCSDATGCRVQITYYFEGEEVGKIDTDKVGTYTIKYIAIDGAGNQSFEAIKTVEVIGINALDTTSILIIAGVILIFGGLATVAIILEVKKNKKNKKIK